MYEINVVENGYVLVEFNPLADNEVDEIKTYVFADMNQLLTRLGALLEGLK